MTKIVNINLGIPRITDMIEDAFNKNIPFVMPTETVYGLAAKYNDSKTIENIFKFKKRPADNPLIVHISNIEQLKDLIKADLTAKEKNVIDKFWPGPLTIIFEKSELVPDIVSAGLSTVAVRMPELEVTRNLIMKIGTPLVAPSANISGRPSPTNAKDALEDMNNLVEVIVDAGECSYGFESTIIKIEGEICKILRPGNISTEQLSEFFDKVENSYLNIDESAAPQAPGMKYRHYAPNAKVLIVEKNVIKKLVVLDSELVIRIGSGINGNPTELVYANEDLLAKDIYKIFRQADRDKIETIYIERPTENLALINRVEKACL